ncbi:MAG: class I adenylate-forming enzyme family protein, partial [Nitrospinales bacterium]
MSVEKRVQIEYIESVFRENADREFVVDSNLDLSLTYRDVFELSGVVARVFLERGACSGKNIAIILPNCFEFVLVYFACMHHGVVPVPVNPSLLGKEASFIVETSGAEVLVTSEKLAVQFASCVESFGERAMALPLAGDCKEEGRRLDWFNDLNQRREPGNIGFPNLKDDSRALIMYTSGTTSVPKGVMLKYGPTFANGREFIRAVGIREASSFYGILSLAYMGGWYNLMIIPCLAGGKVVLDHAFNAKSLFNFWDKVKRFGVDVLWLVPTIMTLLMTSKKKDAGAFAKDQIKLGLVGTAPLPVSLKREFEERFGFETLENYGLSETLLITTNAGGGEDAPGSVGKAMRGCEIKIVPVTPGDKDGEILVKTDYLMEGYFKNEKDFVVENGFFRTGDIGYLDEKGRLFITGRKKDLIIRGGINISPGQIEKVLYDFPGVEEAAVVGIPSSLLGEEIVAFVKIEAEKAGSFQVGDLQERCSRELSKF